MTSCRICWRCRKQKWRPGRNKPVNSLKPHDSTVLPYQLLLHIFISTETYWNKGLWQCVRPHNWNEKWLWTGLFHQDFTSNWDHIHNSEYTLIYIWGLMACSTLRVEWIAPSNCEVTCMNLAKLRKQNNNTGKSYLWFGSFIKPKFWWNMPVQSVGPFINWPQHLKADSWFLLQNTYSLHMSKHF